MKRIILNLSLLILLMSACSGEKVVNMRDYGIVPDTKENLSSKMQEALVAIKQANEGKKVTLLFEDGRYDFHSEGAVQKEYYVSNHDQPNPKAIGLALEDWKDLTLDGAGADFIFHGRMLPLSLLRSENTVLKNFSIDFEMENGVHLHSMCRQIDGCSNAVGEIIYGTKGVYSSFDNTIKDLKGNVLWKYDEEAAKAEFKQHNPYVLEHVDWVNHIRKGTAHDEATECAISSLAGVMGRESAYTGRTITWDEMSKSDLDLMPAKLELGEMDMTAYQVAVPGKAK